jgi:hypothetical protein
MSCASTTLRVATIVFAGINHSPINKTAEVTMGGEIADGTVTNSAGKAFSGTKIEPGEVDFEMPNTAEFNPDNYRGQCGDLQVLTSDGNSYLCTNARLKAGIKVKDGEPTVKLGFIGDVIIPF